ncbi:SGNH/GDSL hydrolase family protein [Verrucomicrobiota bacterium]
MKRLFSIGLFFASFILSTAIAEDKSQEISLPRILIIGDSISMGYTPQVIQKLKGKAIVQHNTGNAGPTMRGIDDIEKWLGNTKWDIIQFNWGLWDMYGWKYNKHDRTPSAYEKRLDTLVVQLKKTGSRLIWATTTPACPEPEKKSKVKIDPTTESEYLAAAERVMKKHNIRINDLHALIAPELAQYARANNDVHFTKAGYGKLAEQVADTIEQLIKDADKK